MVKISLIFDGYRASGMGGVHKTVTVTVVCSAVAVLIYYPVM